MRNKNKSPNKEKAVVPLVSNYKEQHNRSPLGLGKDFKLSKSSKRMIIASKGNSSNLLYLMKKAEKLEKEFKSKKFTEKV